VGRALDFLPYFLYVVQETGKSGLGRARVPYRLLMVTDGSHPDGPVIFQADTGIVRDVRDYRVNGAEWRGFQ
jgi:hypothetical protein